MPAAASEVNAEREARGKHGFLPGRTPVFDTGPHRFVQWHKPATFSKAWWEVNSATAWKPSQNDNTEILRMNYLTIRGDINWDARTICFTRKKLKSHGTNIKPTSFPFSTDIETILQRRPTSGQLFPYLSTVRAWDRATEIKRRCVGVRISGVSLHCYGYARVERALKCRFPERFAQQTLGRNSKAMHRAYAKHAEVTVPSLADWKKDWKENPQRNAKTKILPMDFRSMPMAITRSN
jgi:hypothetical protein